MKKGMPLLFSVILILSGFGANAISINNSTKSQKVLNFDEYDMAIIAPEGFSEAIQPLIEHKNTYGVETFLKTKEEIYNEYQGNDEAEQIKYFIKDAIEKYNISYCLLVGDVTKIPMRTINFHFTAFDLDALTDLYYSDVYDENLSFCSWDADNDGVYGEALYHCYPLPDYINDLPGQNTQNIDMVDLYPDIHLGRLPCSNTNELEIIIEKIIQYETSTYNQEWFKRIILVGGDTFPPCLEQVVDEPYGLYEGEITNQEISDQLPDFESIKLWTSIGNCNALKFNRELNKGAGFLSISTHGYEMGWSTYRPDEMNEKRTIKYHNIYLKGLKNNKKYPIAFLDACSTATLDFNTSLFKSYYPFLGNLMIFFRLLVYNQYNLIPCFAWNLVKMENSGAIAAIGSTRWSFIRVDQENGSYAGLSYLNLEFFKQYNNDITVGEMFTQSIHSYISNLTKAFRLLENIILIGDPSLKIGGYP